MRSRRSNRGENSNGDGFSFSKFLNSITPHFKRKNKDGEISPNRKKRKNFNQYYIGIFYYFCIVYKTKIIAGIQLIILSKI